MKKRKGVFKSLLVVGLLLNPLMVKADWAGCYSQLNSNSSYSYGDIITYDLGTSGVTSNASINGFHYHIEYDPSVLEVVSTSNGGVGSYHGWEKINLGIIKSNTSRFYVAEVDVQTDDKNKFVLPIGNNSNSDNFIKLGYIKFKVINDNVSNTKLELVESWDYDRVNYGYSMTSYKYIYDYENGQSYKDSGLKDSDYEEPCYDTVNTHVNIYKKAYINDISINNNVIKNYSKDVYVYNLTYTTKTIDISANAQPGYNVSGDIGKKTLSYGNNVYKISVTSPTGDKKEYILNINYPDNRSKVNTLKSLTLSSGNIDFKPEQNEYDLEVAYEIDKITINSELTNSKATYVKDFGNREVNLELGKNKIIIKVQSESGIENIYTINITRNEPTNLRDIKDIKINGYKFAFDSSKTNYSLTIDPKVNTLQFNVTLVNEESSYKIIGNENLENGSQIIIKVKDKNNQEKDYIINIIKDMSIIEKEKNKKTIIIFSSIIAVGILTTIGTVIYLQNKKKPADL